MMRAAMVLAILAVLLAPLGTAAAEPKQYGFVFLQGRISDERGRPLVGARVRLSGRLGANESVTEANGAFVFERLPMTPFKLEIVAADGRVLRGLRELDPTDPDQVRAEIVLGNPRSARKSARAPEQMIVVPVGDEQVSLVGPAQTPNWRRLRRQGLIFIGAALLLAL
ncbi:MAG: carboxypeptidase regulatory-like domain-containing protein [bacterium]|nr:carboxypeptidase regulatory-like domain-containing protein [bacterium]